VSTIEPLTPTQRAVVQRVKARILEALAGKATLIERPQGDNIVLGLRCSTCERAIEHETEPRLELQTWLVLEDANHEHWPSRDGGRFESMR
jgi:hypothetical protein